VVAGFAVNHAANLILALGNNQMHIDGARLAKSPAPPHGLIPSLITEAAAHERHPRGMLPVQPHPGHARLGDDVSRFPSRERR
jgi:hypothetical protein